MLWIEDNLIEIFDQSVVRFVEPHASPESRRVNGNSFDCTCTGGKLYVQDWVNTTKNLELSKYLNRRTGSTRKWRDLGRWSIVFDGINTKN